MAISFIDYNDIDSIESTMATSEQIAENIDLEYLNDKLEDIQNQYFKFENLNINVLNQVREEKGKYATPYLIKLCEQILDDIETNFLNGVNFNPNDDEEVIKKGEALYRLLVIYFPSNIDNILQGRKISDVIHELTNETTETYSTLRALILSNLNDVLALLIKLSTVDKSVTNLESYEKTLDDYKYYIELFQSTDLAPFVKNYFIPLLLKIPRWPQRG